jgi:hypothetical protein
MRLCRRKDGGLIEISLCVSPMQDEEEPSSAPPSCPHITQQAIERQALSSRARLTSHQKYPGDRQCHGRAVAVRYDGLKAAIRGRIQALANVRCS